MRYELKYSVSHLSPEAIREELLSHPASFTELFPDRQVNNIYFDSSIFHCFHQNVEGHPRRKKMRLRWYGKEALPLSGSVLEIKQKDKELGWKDSYNVESSITDSATLMDAVSKQGMSSTDLQPVLKNTYLRSYLISHGGFFRVTIDRLQTFAFPFSEAAPFENKLYPTIIELKYDADKADEVASITDYLKFRQSKNSKYVNGVEELYL